MIKEILDWVFARKHGRRGREIFDIRTLAFHEKAKEISGLNWDFSRMGGGSYRCCVEPCRSTRLWGHWTCDRHIGHEKLYFHPVDEYGNTFWSHVS